MTINLLNSNAPDFNDRLTAILARSDAPDAAILTTVQDILNDVRQRGDTALLEYTNRFDRREATPDDLEIAPASINEALEQIDTDIRRNLEQAANRIRDYHQHQLQESWLYKDGDGNTLGQQVTALDKVGIYVPGGKAAYPSSVLMNAIPAHVAGVQEIIMVVPCPDGIMNPLVLAAAAIAGVHRVFSIGGAQAIAALAYGTERVPRVDKIVGPGNQYVATAKRLVFGQVGIDMIAGPSEILILSDGSTDPDWLAMDLFSQAEHDEEACSILISPDADSVQAVQESIERLLPGMERASIIRTSLKNNGALITVASMDEAVVLANRIAPEHLEISAENPEALLPKIRHAGAVFLGAHTAEVLGDYCAGPNHVLPTSRTARFSSPLGVYDFQKKTSVIQCTAESASRIATTAAVLARGEGLTAHARSAEYRIKQ